MRLQSLGWNTSWAEEFARAARADQMPARVAAQHRKLYRVWYEGGELVAEVSGRLRHEAATPQEFPAVGDWAIIEARPQERRATIHAVLPRRSRFARKVAGREVHEQVAAANVDLAFLFTALDHDFSLRRIERYLTLCYDGGVAPVVVLNKSDLCAEASERLADTKSVAIGAPVHVVSCATGDGLEELAEHLCPANTVVLLGSSGVGKSTLINRFLGRELLPTAPVRAGDSKGRHTTSARQMFVLSSGALLIDTPGTRELQLAHAEEGIGAAFADIEMLAAVCRFRDCAHGEEPGCAVRGAVSAGQLAAGRLESFHRQARELARLDAKDDVLGAIERKRKERIIQRLAKAFYGDNDSR